MKKDDKQQIRDAFAKRFRLAMKEAGVIGSVRERAKALNIPKSTLEGYENAEKLPSRGRSISLSAILGVREDWLMTGDQPMKAASLESLQISHFSEEDQTAIMSVWRSMNEKY